MNEKTFIARDEGLAIATVPGSMERIDEHDPCQ